MNTRLLFLPDNRFPWRRRRAAIPAARPRGAAAAVAVSVLAVMGVAAGGPTEATAVGPLPRVHHTGSAVAAASVPHTPLARVTTTNPTTPRLSRKIFGGGDVSIEDQRYVRVTDNGGCPVNFRVTDLTFRSTAGTIALPTDAISFDGRPCTVDGVKGLFGAAFDVSLTILEADQRDVLEAIGGHDDGAALLLLPTGWDCGEGGKGRDDAAFFLFTTATSKTALLGADQGQPLALLSVGSDLCFYAIGGGGEGDNDNGTDDGPDGQASGGVRGSHNVDQGGSGGTHVAPIVGAVFGALFAVALLVGVVFCIVRRRRKAAAEADAGLPPLAEGVSPPADMPPAQLAEANGGAPAPDTWTSASAEPPPSGGAPVLAAADPGGGRRPSVPGHPGHGPPPHAGQGPPLGGGTRPDPPGSHPLAAPHPTHNPHAVPGGAAPPGLPPRPPGPEAQDGNPSGDAWPLTGGTSPVIDSMDGTSALWGSNPGGPPGAAAAAAASATAPAPARARPAGGGWPAGATATSSAGHLPPPPMPAALLSTVGTEDGGGVGVAGGPWAELPPTMPSAAAPAQAIDEWLASPDGLYQSF